MGEKEKETRNVYGQCANPECMKDIYTGDFMFTLHLEEGEGENTVYYTKIMCYECGDNLEKNFKAMNNYLLN